MVPGEPQRQGLPKRDWYWWRPPREGMEPGAPGAEPTNWAAAFGGSAWEFDARTGEYYLHLFSRKQPDLNWENEQVREAVYTMMRWWLDRGVDGFRMDVINMISKDPALPDGRVSDRGVFPDGAAGYVNGPRVHEFLQEMHERVFAGRDAVLTVGEMPGVTIEEAVLFTDPRRRELDMVFQFDHVWADRGEDPWQLVPLKLTRLKAILGRWQAGLAERGWNSLYWNNHDQPRAVSRYGDDGPAHRVASAKMLGTVLHLHRGTPYVYQGEELGMTNHPFETIADFRDIEALGQYAEATRKEGRTPEEVLTVLRARGRDNARTPMQWDTSPHAGFTTGRPWLAVNPNHDRINAAAQYEDPDSVYHYYRRLIELRHTEPAVADGDFRMLLPHDERVYAFTRRLGATELLVLGNFTGTPVKPDLPDAPAWSSADLLLTNLAPPPPTSPWPRGRRWCTGGGWRAEADDHRPLGPEGGAGRRGRKGDMGLGIYVLDRRGRQISYLPDDTECTARNACTSAPPDSMRRGVMVHGDTTFNRLQLAGLVEELEALEAPSRVIDDILEAARFARDRSYYLFIAGD